MKPTTTNANATIQDDWEEVNDDDFSVVSVATTENRLSDSRESLVPVDVPTYVSVSSVDQHDQQNDRDTTSNPSPVLHPDAATTTTTTAIPATPTTSQRHLTDKVPAEEPHRSVERLDGDTKEVVKPHDEDVPSQLLQQQHPDPDVGANAVDPSSLNKANATLKLLVEETRRLASSGGPDTIVSECNALWSGLHDLTPILEGYAQRWELRRGDFEPPLDPGLREWMSSLQAELFTLQDDLLDPLARSASGVQRATNPQGVARHEEALTALRSRIQVFLPVMQADYAAMNLGSEPSAHVSSDGGRAWPSPPRTAEGAASQRENTQNPNTVGYLRRELCELKDQVSACVDEIGAYQQWRAATTGGGEDLSVVGGIATAYRSIKFSLETTMANHFADWAPGQGQGQGQAQGHYDVREGGLTYAQLCRLDPDAIRSLHRELRDVAAKLAHDRARVQSMRYLNDPDGLLDREDAPPLDNSRVEHLFALEERIASTLTNS